MLSDWQLQRLRVLMQESSPELFHLCDQFLSDRAELLAKVAAKDRIIEDLAKRMDDAIDAKYISVQAVREECCKAVCIECRNNVPIVSTPELYYGHWLQYVDGDREQELVDCEAWEIRKQMEE